MHPLITFACAVAVAAAGKIANEQAQSPPPPPRRLRAADFRLNKNVEPPVSSQNGPDLIVECAMRSVAFDMAMRHPAAHKNAAMIKESLNVTQCPNAGTLFQTPLHPTISTSTSRTTLTAAAATTGTTFYLDCENGSAENTGLTKASAFKTVHQAQLAARAAPKPATIVVRGGVCYLGSPLVLTPADSSVTWEADASDATAPVFSGGALLSGMKWAPATDLVNRLGDAMTDGKIMVATLPDGVNGTAIDSLFSLPSSSTTTTTSSTTPLARQSIGGQTRLVRARYPNGNSEDDRMPTNYDKLGGGVSSMQEWRKAGNVSKRIPGFTRNSSFYPWFGHSNDLRWVLDYHAENASSIYSPGRQFWQADVGTAAHYNSTTFSPRVDQWTNVADAVLHVIHYDWWGNWQWGLDSINTTTKTFKFGQGGWQDAHGGPVASNYFFAENILEELDSPGEWYVDKTQRKIYYWPTAAAAAVPATDWKFAASQLSTIVSFEGTSDSPVRDVVMDGITFAHSTTTYLSERYAVPSAGDWSVLPKGAVTMSGVVGATLQSCSWTQVGGNGVAFSGYVHDTSILDGDFVKTGDSGVVSVGELPAATPHDGTAEGAAVPTNNTIARCHFGQHGVFGKQTSALFVAVSKGIKFTDNVLYDGPRAGVNINDGFGGGHVLARNVIFNQLLESGDHGPVNTWSRTAYLQKDGSASASNASATTTIQEWTEIDNNFVMVGPKFGSLYGPGDGPCSNGMSKFSCPKGGGSMFTCLDHDDGSDYYLDTRNVCVFAGMKNYIGQNKIWDSNLIAYADGALSQNRSGMPSVWTSMNMGGNTSLLPCTAVTGPCHNREVFTNNTCVTHRFQPTEYDMFNAADLAKYGPHDTTMPYTANNKYYLGIPYNFNGWNLSEAQAHGVDAGSEVFPEMTPNQLSTAARALLGL